MPDGENVQGQAQEPAKHITVTDGNITFSDEAKAGFASLLEDASVITEEGGTPANDTVTDIVEEETRSAEPEPKGAQKWKLKVDGEEEEVSQEELLARAQMGTHYTKQMQQLRERERAMAPYDSLFRQLQMDPNLNKHIADYFAGARQSQPQREQPPDDPIEALKWEAKQEALKEIRAEVEPLKQQAQEIARRQERDAYLSSISRDPLFGEVHAEINKLVRSIPDGNKMIEVYRKLDSDPKAYNEVYQKVRDQLAKTKQAAQTGAPQQGQNGQQPPVPRKSETERAPFMESAGIIPAESEVSKQRDIVTKSKARALRTGDTDALAEFLRDGGFLKGIA